MRLPNELEPEPALNVRKGVNNIVRYDILAATGLAEL
jgi:hypothetical protein